MSYFVTPIDPDRRAGWVERLNRETLPVSDPRPRHGRAGLVYDVATNQLNHLERARLAAVLAEQAGGGYWNALVAVEELGASIPAIGLALLTEDE